MGMMKLDIISLVSNEKCYFYVIIFMFKELQKSLMENLRCFKSYNDSYSKGFFLKINI